MERSDGGYGEYQSHATLPEGPASFGGVRRTAFRRYSEGPVVTLKLRRRDTGGIFARASFHPGNDKEERAARAFLAQQDSAWWYNAPHYIGDGLEIVEA
jgi:hypothetical protein